MHQSLAPVALVTGAAGFVGTWLLRHAQELGWTLIGVRKPGVPSPPLEVQWVDVDLRERTATHALLQETRPRYILHLAALAVPRAAAEDPLEALRLNYAAVDHLLGGMARYTPEARMLYVGTGEVYGPKPEGSPLLREDDPLSPPNLYSATKAAAELRTQHAVEREDWTSYACDLSTTAARSDLPTTPSHPLLVSSSPASERNRSQSCV